VPAHARREDARLDGGEDLRGQPVEADVGGRAWSATMHLQLSGLRQHVEAEAEIGPVGEAVHGRRIAVDRELERGLDLEVLEGRRLQSMPLIHRRFGSRIRFIPSGVRRSGS
jgi:hypothetical protein